PRRPWLTRSSARPRTPTIRPSATPTSRPQPVEQRTHTDGTQRCGASVARSSTRTGQAPWWGVRGPQISSMLSRLSRAATGRALNGGTSDERSSTVGRFDSCTASISRFLVCKLLKPLLDATEASLDLLLTVLRLVASLVHEGSGENDQEEDLEKLGLPVLERPLAEIDDETVRAPEGRRAIVLRLIGDVLPPAEDSVEHERQQEQDPDNDAEAVVAPEATQAARVLA